MPVAALQARLPFSTPSTSLVLPLLLALRRRGHWASLRLTGGKFTPALFDWRLVLFLVCHYELPRLITFDVT